MIASTRSCLTDLRRSSERKLEILKLLESTKFPVSTYRVIASKSGKCQTITFGKTGLASRTWNSVHNKRSPELYKLLVEFADELDPNFEYTSITINKNFKSYPHYDIRNAGQSMIIALGSYTGGELVVEGIPVDIRTKFYFNGSLEKHWTNDFIGERYSIIYFTRT